MHFLIVSCLRVLFLYSFLLFKTKLNGFGGRKNKFTIYCLPAFINVISQNATTCLIFICLIFGCIKSCWYLDCYWEHIDFISTWNCRPNVTFVFIQHWTGHNFHHINIQHLCIYFLYLGKHLKVSRVRSNILINVLLLQNLLN